MFCRRCGNRIPDDSKFCPQCGAALAAGVTRASPAASDIRAGPLTPPPPAPARSREQADADDRALFDLMDFEKINGIHQAFVSYFSAHDYPRMKDTCDSGAGMVAGLISRIAALYPNPPLVPVKEEYLAYLRAARHMFESYSSAATAFQGGQGDVGENLSSEGNSAAINMNRHLDALTALLDNLSNR